MSFDRKRVRIIGAGFSGLTAAYYLNEAGYEVEVHEKSNRVGGLIFSERTKLGLVERAANGILNTARLEAMAERVGLKLYPTLKTARRRFIFREGRPRRFPLKLTEALNLFLGVFKFIFLRQSMRPNAGESVREWGTRVIGLKASHFTVETAFQGIYAGNPEKLSASIILRRLFTREKKVSRAKVSGTVAPRDGMGELISRLEEYLKINGVKIYSGSEFLKLESREVLKEPLILATEVTATTQILSEYDPERARALGQVERVPIVTVTIFLKNLGELKGFGCLFPPGPAQAVLGVLFNDCVFSERANEGLKSETWILGGADHGQKLIKLADDEILEIIKQQRAQIFTEYEPVDYRICRWPQAFPHYDLKMEKAIESYKENRKNVFLHGNYIGRLGLAQILEQAKLLVDEIEVNGRWIK